MTINLETIGQLLRTSFEPVGGEALPRDLTLLLERLAERTAPPHQALADREFKRLLTDAIPGLRAFARNLARDETMADDLVQETMLRAWTARERFQAGTSFKAWTYTILRNQFLSRMRRNRFAGDWDDEAAETLLSARPDQDRRLHVEDVERAMAKLPAAQREALLLVGAEDLTYEEVAVVTNVPLGTVKSRVARGRAMLSRLVEGGDVPVGL